MKTFFKSTSFISFMIIIILLSACKAEETQTIGNKIEISRNNEVAIYANEKNDTGSSYEELTVETKNINKTFPWKNATNPSYAPIINIADVDNDTKDEIIILLTTGYGTGVHVQEIHILNVEDLIEIDIEDPIEAINNTVTSSITKSEDKVNIVIKCDGNTIEKSYDKSYAGIWNEKIAFGAIVTYEIVNNRIIAKVPGAMSPSGLPITAVLEYDENLKVINIGVEDNEPEKTDNEIDRTEYLTGEIIADGNYSYPSDYVGIIYFIPDVESGKIIKEKYNETAESLILMYDDMSKVENLPKELGIYKVRVKIELDDTYNYLLLNDIQLADKIGTIMYEGKTYDNNELDENVKVKDKVCGLIVEWIDRVDNGIQIRFAGEIESEGYYFINYSEMYDYNIGRIYFDEEYYNNIPILAEKGFNNFMFIKTNELFDELENFSSFSRGRFKTSNYHLVYNIGMGRPASDYLTEIISLDENYKNMFEFDKYKYVGPIGDSKDFIILSSANYDENFNYISTDFYYINKNQPEKIFLFNSLGYNYELKAAADENEFIVSTDGFNMIKSETDEGHSIICRITENGAVTEKIEGLNIDSDKIDDNGRNFNMQGYIANIEIKETKVIMSIKDVKMKEEDALAFGKILNKDELIDILIVDNNRSGPVINVGDKIMVSCRYTKDNEFLYTFGADIR
ncbi:MAG: hypothetical protein WBJ13_11600 [Sedimentibacter sp.]